MYKYDVRMKTCYTWTKLSSEEHTYRQENRWADQRIKQDRTERKDRNLKSTTLNLRHTSLICKLNTEQSVGRLIKIDRQTTERHPHTCEHCPITYSEMFDEVTTIVTVQLSLFVLRCGHKWLRGSFGVSADYACSRNQLIQTRDSTVLSGAFQILLITARQWSCFHRRLSVCHSVQWVPTWPSSMMDWTSFYRAPDPTPDPPPDTRHVPPSHGR